MDAQACRRLQHTSVVPSVTIRRYNHYGGCVSASTQTTRSPILIAPSMAELQYELSVHIVCHELAPEV